MSLLTAEGGAKLVTALPDAMIELELDRYRVKHTSFSLDLVIGVGTLRPIGTGYEAR
ncbi:MAG: hypothetical protein ABI277_17185 [Burkholderiaceae bacterium]